ncbi:hypothetical protein CMK12_15870 [Candidatus Poribacteria bacterium]|nr:hypothetical protein [Candidatus Poribacteria bacterium]
MRIVRDLWQTAGTFGTIFILTFISLVAIIATILPDSIAMIIASFISLLPAIHFASKQKFVINKDEDYLQYQTSLLFLKRIKLSEIESYKPEIKTTKKKGKTSKTYKLNITGTFGHKLLHFSSQEPFEAVHNHLKWAKT